MRYTKVELKRWIRDIEDNTRRRCFAIRDRFAGRRDAKAAWLDGPDSNDRLFASLLTGDFQMMRRESFRPEWVSWIEGAPPYHWLMTHEQVLVDLIPCGRTLFVEKYGCTPEQFASLIERMPGSIRVNVRNDFLHEYANGEVIDAMGEILALSERFPDSFYRLQPIRDTAFTILDASYPALMERAAMLCRNYARFHEEDLATLAATADDDLVMTRTGHWPVPGQFTARMAYYLLARQLWNKAGGPIAADDMIEEWIAKDEPIDFAMSDLHALKQRLGRLYTTHHLYTAPLTGALGGQYGWLPGEMDYAAYVRGNVVPPTDPTARISLSTWLFALQAGLAQFGASNLDNAPLPLWRRPDDAEWRSFLDRVGVNRHKVRESMSVVSDVIERATARAAKKGEHLDTEGRLEDLVKLLDTIHNQCVGVRQASAAMLGFGLSAISVSYPIMAAMLPAIWGVAKAFPHLEKRCEHLESLSSKLCKNRMDRTAILGFVNRLDLPQRRPGG